MQDLTPISDPDFAKGSYIDGVIFFADVKGVVPAYPQSESASLARNEQSNGAPVDQMSWRAADDLGMTDQIKVATTSKAEYKASAPTLSPCSVVVAAQCARKGQLLRRQN